MDDLQITDYRILEYIDKNEFVRLSQISIKFSIDCTERINQLLNKKYIENEIVSYQETESFNGVVISARPILSDRLQLTAKGKIEIQNFKEKQKTEQEAKRWENIRWFIATLIAVAALINSIFARLGL